MYIEVHALLAYDQVAKGTFIIVGGIVEQAQGAKCAFL